MSSESVLREQLATCTRIFAMQGVIGLFGHVSAFDPSSRRVFISPGLGSDKATTKPDELFVLDPEGKVLEGKGDVPIEWPIHTALHARRANALAVAHLHAPSATLFSIAEREFRPVTLQGGTLFGDGVAVYPEAHLIRTAEHGRQLAELMGDKRAALLRGHGIVVAGRDLEEILFAALILEDDTAKAIQAAALGRFKSFSPEECRLFATEVELARRARKAWGYFASLEQRWDRQPATGYSTLA